MTPAQIASKLTKAQRRMVRIAAQYQTCKFRCFGREDTKFGTNKPTALQVGFLNSIRQEKGFAFVVTEKSIDHLAMWLQAFDNAAEAVGSQKAVADQDGADMLDALAALTVLI